MSEGDEFVDINGKPMMILGVPIATFCMIVNFILPGFGTIISAFVCLCVGRHLDTRKKLSQDMKITVCYITVILGLLQLVCVGLLLLGWVWSIAYGIQLRKLAVKYQKKKDKKKKRKNQVGASGGDSSSDSDDDKKSKSSN